MNDDTTTMEPQEAYRKLKAQSDSLPGCEGFGWMGLAAALVIIPISVWAGIVIASQGSPWFVAFLGVLLIILSRFVWKVAHGAYHAGYAAALLANFERVQGFIDAVREAVESGELNE